MGFLATFSGGGSPAYKEPVRTATSSPISLSSAPASISSVTLNLNDRILVKDQADATQNGIYLFKGAGNPLVRAADANTSRELVPGLVVSVTEGDNGERTYQLITDAPIVLGTTDLDFALAVDLEADVEGILPVENGGTGVSTWSEGRVIFAGTSGETLAQDAGLHWDNSNKRLGIGLSTPSAKLQISNSGSQAGLSVYSTSTNNTATFFNQGITNYTVELNSAADSAFTGASIGGYFARGTLSARTQTLANDSLLSITASGHTGTSVAGISAGIVLAADQNTGASAFGGQIVFATTPNNTAALLPTARMVVKNDGKVGIGTLLPTEQLDVSGNIKANNFYIGDGSVTNPSFVFSSDLDTGIYRPGTNSLVIVANGNSALQLTGSGATATAVLANGGNATLNFNINATTGYGTIQARGNNLLLFDANRNTTLQGALFISNTFTPFYTPAERLEVAGNIKGEGLLLKSRHGLTGTVSVATNDYYLGCDASGGMVALTLPSAATAKQGRKLVIKSEAATGLVTITAASGESIDGSPAHILNASYESVTLVCNGTNAWFIV